MYNKDKNSTIMTRNNNKDNNCKKRQQLYNKDNNYTIKTTTVQ